MITTTTLGRATNTSTDPAGEAPQDPISRREALLGLAALATSFSSGFRSELGATEFSGPSPEMRIWRGAESTQALSAKLIDCNYDDGRVWMLKDDSTPLLTNARALSGTDREYLLSFRERPLNQNPAERVWRSADNGSSFFIGGYHSYDQKSNMVTFQRAGGPLFSIPLDALSVGDKEFLRSLDSPSNGTELIGQPVSSDPEALRVCESLDVVISRRKGSLLRVSMTISHGTIMETDWSNEYVSFFDIEKTDLNNFQGFGPYGDGSEWFGRPSHIAAELRRGQVTRLYLSNESGVRILEPRPLQEAAKRDHLFRLVGTIDTAEAQGDLNGGAAAGVAIVENRLYVVNSALGCLYEFDARGRKLTKTITLGLSKPGPVAVSDDGSFIVVGERQGGEVRVFDRDGQPRFVVPQTGEKSEFLALFFTPNENNLVVYRGATEKSAVYRVGK